MELYFQAPYYVDTEYQYDMVWYETGIWHSKDIAYIYDT